MLRRTFLGTLAALPIVGVPFRAIGLAVSFETCRFTIRWESEPDAPDIVIALYSDESVRCWLGDTELSTVPGHSAGATGRSRRFTGYHGSWGVELALRGVARDRIDIAWYMLWRAVSEVDGDGVAACPTFSTQRIRPRQTETTDYDPHFGLAQPPLPKDYGIGYWIDLDDSGSE